MTALIRAVLAAHEHLSMDDAADRAVLVRALVEALRAASGKEHGG